MVKKDRVVMFSVSHLRKYLTCVQKLIGQCSLVYHTFNANETFN